MEAKKQTPFYKHLIYGVFILCILAVLTPVCIIVLPIYFYFDFKKAKLKIGQPEQTAIGGLLKSFFIKESSKQPVKQIEKPVQDESYKYDSLEKMLKAKNLQKL